MTTWLAAVGAAVITTLLLPEVFRSTALVLVEQGAYRSGRRAGAMQAMESHSVLAEIVTSLNLNIEWGRRYRNGNTLQTARSIEVLRGRLRVLPAQQSNLISIEAFSEDRQEAARLANTLADVYRGRSVGRQYRRIAARIETLEYDHRENLGQLEKLLRQLQDFDTGQATEPTVNRNELQRQLEQQQRLLVTLSERIADQKRAWLKVDERSPRILARAVPEAASVRPNKPLNFLGGVLIGGFLGCVLAVTVFGLQHRSARHLFGDQHARLVHKTRNLLHAVVALAAGISAGYNIALFIDFYRLFLLLLVFILGCVAAALIELCNPSPSFFYPDLERRPSWS